MDWFLYDRDLGHKRVNQVTHIRKILLQTQPGTRLSLNIKVFHTLLGSKLTKDENNFMQKSFIEQEIH